MAAPPFPTEGTRRLIIATTPDTESLQGTGVGALVVRGGRVQGFFGPVPRVFEDVEDEMALGNITGQAGGRGGEDEIGSALKMMCSTLDNLARLSSGWPDPWTGLMIRLPRKAMKTVAGLRNPLPGHTEVAQKARETLLTLTRSDNPNGYPVWLAGPEPGPRGARARALARIGVKGPVEDSNPRDGEKQQDPWATFEAECPICYETYKDQLPDILEAYSRTTPFRCIEGHRHGACWWCCTELKNRAEDRLGTAQCPMCRAEMDSEDKSAFEEQYE